MPKRLTTLLFFLCFCLVTPSVYGQTVKKKKRTKRSNGVRFISFDPSADSLETKVLEDGFFYGGANYTSQVTTLGRDNNVKQWAIAPSVGFHKNSIDVYVNSFRWSETTPRWAETDIGIAKTWQISNFINVVASYEHAFIRYGTDDDKYGLNNLFSTTFSWTNKWFDLDTRYEYDWGVNCGSILEFSLGRQFDVFNKATNAKIEITPRIYMTYLGGNTYPGRLLHNYAPCNEGDQSFKIANYELELPITWRKIGNWEAGVTFNYAIPKNVLPEEGNSKSTFYMTAGIVKIFRLKTK